MKLRKICVVTGSRADYGLLQVVMQEIAKDRMFSLQVVATGMHLSPEFGLTSSQIAQDGFTINAKVEMLLSSDTPVGIAKSIGLGVAGCADVLDQLRPDLLLILGDRFEILAAAQAALVARVPIAHIAGGDTTEGAIDESIRHSITKMSHIHFVTNDASARRVRQMGENPRFVFIVGSPGIDQIRKMSLLNRAELEQELGFSLLHRNLLVTFHPVTLDIQPAEVQFLELLSALDRLGDETGLIFTKPNADMNGRVIISLIDEYVAARSYAKAFTSLGQRRYLSTIACVDAVVGNSSSGIYEVPSFGKPTVNIGDRQKGRLQATSIINCIPDADAIEQAIRDAFVRDCSGTVNPYGDGHCAERIVEVLKSVPDYSALLQKPFYDVTG